MKKSGKVILFIGLVALGISFVILPLVLAKGPEKVLIFGDYTTHRTFDPAFIALGQDILLCRCINQSLLRYKFNT